MSWNIFRQNDLIDPCDPYVTIEVKLLITFIATHPLVILTKFGQNPIKYVEEEINCEKQEERKNKLGETPNLIKSAPSFLSD